MTSKRPEWSIAVRIALLLATLLALCIFLSRRQWLEAVCALPCCLAAVFYFFRYHRKIRREMEEYLLAVHYRDFTRNFSWRDAPAELQPLRRGFNELNEAFKTISREREAQYQYLEKILELVDTGILSFEIATGNVVWINESLKRLLEIPYLKNISQSGKWDTDLPEILQQLRTAENRVISLKVENRAIKVLLTTTAFQTEGMVFKLVAFQNIHEALDETEALAWQKLLSVMTHEIMNSVAPIASLADTLKKRMHPTGDQHDKATLLSDLELGIDTIKRRSEGLTKFAQTYRNLSKITRPELTKVRVSDLFETIYQLMEPTLEQKGIDMEIVLHDTGLVLEIDRNLIEQVLINLVVNAMEAVRDTRQPCITLSGGYDNGKPVLSVTDNGKGIPEALLDRIFVPFFSTRKNGNGIGLSLCKQIMLLHQGAVQVRTVEEKGTSFRLCFS